LPFRSTAAAGVAMTRGSTSSRVLVMAPAIGTGIASRGDEAKICYAVYHLPNGNMG
jgi:hypothetical protein